MDRHNFRWIILGISTLTQLGAALASQGLGVWAPFAQQALQLSNRDIGLLSALLNCVPVVGLVIVGPLLDRCGEKIPIFIGLTLLCLSFLCLAVASDYGLLAVTMLFMGIGYSPIQPGGSKAIYRWFSVQERGLAMGVRQAALPLGGACAAVFFPYMILHSGWNLTMLVAAGIVAFIAVMHMTGFRSLPVARSTATPRLTFAWLYHQARFRQVAIVGAAMVGVQACLTVFWVLLVRQKFNLSIPAAAWQLFVVQLSGAFGRVVLSAISDHVKDGRRRVVLACALVTLMALLIAASLPVGSNALYVLICSAVIGVFSFGWYGPWVVWLSDCVDPDHIGQTLSISLAINQISIALAPLVFGFLLDASASACIGWFFLGALLILAMLYTFYSIASSPSQRP